MPINVTPKPSNQSLARQVFIQVLLTMFIGSFVIGGVSVYSVSQIINRDYDERLVLGANLMANLMRDELKDIAKNHAQNPSFEIDDDFILSSEDRQAFDAYANWRMFRILNNGKIILRSDTGPATQTVQTQNPPSGFSILPDGENRWRIYTLNIPNTKYMVQVGERLKIRNQLVMKISLRLALPIIAIGIAIMLIIRLAISSGLEGLTRFSRFLTGKETRPPFIAINVAEWPDELSHLIMVINELFARIEDGIKHEKEFVELAAHQLRTPLTSLSIEAQLCARIKDPAELARRLANLQQSTARMSAMVNQLLDFAQLEAISHDSAKSLSVKEFISEALEPLAIIAANRGIDFALSGEDFNIFGQEVALNLLLSNLLSNALKHSPNDAEIELKLFNITHKNYGRIEIIDCGRGINDDDKNLAFDKFWQSAGTKALNIAGSGLGLSIAAEAARALGGELSLHDRDDGKTGLRAVFDVPIIN